MCMTAKGLMNRAHAYKAAVADNEAVEGKDPDQAIMMNLYCYPILMAADILLFKATKVPVGRDQKQHVEMARDIAQRFNHHFGETFTLPDAVIGDNVAVLPGLDGRKMSKSYDNTIPLFTEGKALRKLVMKVKTNSLEPGEPKDPDDSALFAMFQAFASPEETAQIRERYAAGIAWGEMKQLLYERIDARACGRAGEVSAARREPGARRGAARAGRGESSRREPAVHRGNSRARRHQAARRTLRSRVPLTRGLCCAAGGRTAFKGRARRLRASSAPAPRSDLYQIWAPA